MANSTPLLSLRPFDGRASGIQLLALLANKAHNGIAPLEYWRREVRIGDFTGAAAVTQELDLHDDLTAAALNRKGQSGLFPADVLVFGCYVRTITDFSGGVATTATAQVGDTGDPNGLFTATSVFTGVGGGLKLSTVAAAEYALHPELAFIPTLTLTSDVNISTLTAGALEVVIPYFLAPRDTDAA